MSEEFQGPKCAYVKSAAQELFGLYAARHAGDAKYLRLDVIRAQNLRMDPETSTDDKIISRLAAKLSRMDKNEISEYLESHRSQLMVPISDADRQGCRDAVIDITHAYPQLPPARHQRKPKDTLTRYLF